LVTALLDAGMGGACWTVLDRDQAFLTADLRVEFLRSAYIGTLIARVGRAAYPSRGVLRR
jgi:acyl-coenzyme A thioesterase PaaI-like protein